MATFSTNQVRHVYVANSIKTTGSGAKNPTITNEGDLGVFKVYDSNKEVTGIKIVTKGKGGIVASDIIDKNKVVSVTVTSATKMRHKVKGVNIIPVDDLFGSNGKIDPNYVGKDFLVRINFEQYIGMSDEETMIKHGVVRAFSGMTKAKFLNTLALSLAQNMGREIQELVKVYLATTTKGGTEQAPTYTTTIGSEVKKSDKITDLNANHSDTTSIIIKEVQQPWSLGVTPETFVNFRVTTATVDVDNCEMDVFDVKDFNTGEVFGNGRRIADLEYFSLGDRADLYRNIGWPNSIPSKTFLDGTGEYDVTDIVYFFSGNAEDVQRSRKQITIVTPYAASSPISSTLKTAITGALGTSYAGE